MKVVGTTKIVDYKVVDYKTGQRRMCLSNKLAKGEHSPLENLQEKSGFDCAFNVNEMLYSVTEF